MILWFLQLLLSHEKPENQPYEESSILSNAIMIACIVKIVKVTEGFKHHDLHENDKLSTIYIISHKLLFKTNLNFRKRPPKKLHQVEVCFA